MHAHVIWVRPFEPFIPRAKRAVRIMARRLRLADFPDFTPPRPRPAMRGKQHPFLAQRMPSLLPNTFAWFGLLVVRMRFVHGNKRRPKKCSHRETRGKGNPCV